MQFEAAPSADDAHAESAALLAKAGKLELELVECEAAGTLHTRAAHLKEELEDILPKLQEHQKDADEHTRSVSKSLCSMLEKFRELLK